MIVYNLMVSYKSYIDYVSKNKTDRLDKFLKIYTYKEFRKSVFESFDKLYQNTQYVISGHTFKKEYSNYINTNGYQIFFKTDSNIEYRIDLIPVTNYNKNINSKFVWNISFTTSNKPVQDINYEELTGLNETKEVLLRMGDILNKINIPKYFIIGDTLLQKKINIYKNFLILVFPNYNIEMSYCAGFLNDKGLYIW